MELAASPSRIGGASEAGGAGSEIRFFESTSGHHLFVTDGSRIYDLSAEESAILKNTADPSDGAGRRDLLRNLGLSPAAKRRHIDATPIEPPKVTAGPKFAGSNRSICRLSCFWSWSVDCCGSWPRRALSISQQFMQM